MEEEMSVAPGAPGSAQRGTRPSGSGPRAIRNVQSSAKNDMIRSTSRLLKASLICFMSAGVGPVVIVISPSSPRRLVRRSQQADLFHERTYTQ